MRCRDGEERQIERIHPFVSYRVQGRDPVLSVPEEPNQQVLSIRYLGCVSESARGGG